MVISKKKETPQCNIKINNTALKQVHQFKYLGTVISSDARCTTEIRSRIAQAKTTFMKMKNIMREKSLPMTLRKRILQCYIEPILLYGSESWTMNKQTIRLLEATEMWFYRRMLKIHGQLKRQMLRF